MWGINIGVTAEGRKHPRGGWGRSISFISIYRQNPCEKASQPFFWALTTTCFYVLQFTLYDVPLLISYGNYQVWFSFTVIYAPILVGQLRSIVQLHCCGSAFMFYGSRSALNLDPATKAEDKLIKVFGTVFREICIYVRCIVVL